MDRVGLAARAHFSLTADHGHARGVAVFTDVNAKRARLPHRESQVRCIDLIEVSFAQFPHAEVDGPFRQTHLHRVLVEIQE